MATHKTTKTAKSTITESSPDSLTKDFTVADKKRWESMSVEELEALSEHNQNVLSGYENTVKTIRDCQTKISNILRKKRHAVIMDKIDAITPEQRFDMLDKIPHSKNCQKLYASQRYDTYTGFGKNYGETPTIECPRCALEYVLNNSWLGIDFFPSVDFDFTEYDGGL